MTEFIRYTMPEAKYLAGKRMVPRELLPLYLPADEPPELISTIPADITAPTQSATTWVQTILQTTAVQTAIGLIKEVITHLFNNLH